MKPLVLPGLMIFCPIDSPLQVDSFKHGLLYPILCRKLLVRIIICDKVDFVTGILSSLVNCLREILPCETRPTTSLSWLELISRHALVHPLFLYLYALP